MKKSTLITNLAFALVLLLSNHVNAQKFSGLDKSPMDAALFRTSRDAPATVKVVYSRPQLKGRDLSVLAPSGKIWRTGANEASEITFYQDVLFGGKAVKAGTYTLFTIPGDSEWTVILNTDVNAWGAYSYNKSKDVARVKAKVTEAGDTLEAFSIAFDEEGTMHLGWDKVRVAIPIK